MFNTQEITKKYALSFFKVAKSLNIVARVLCELRSVNQTISTNAQYNKLMLHKYSPYKVKSLFIKTALSDCVLSAITLNFIELLLRNNRIYALSKIELEFEKLALNDQGILPVHLIVASSDSDFDHCLKAELENMTKSQISLTVIEDNSILAGFIIKIGNTIVNLSLKSKLQKLSKIL